MWLRLVVVDSLNEHSERAASSQNICCRFIENTSSQCNQWSKSLVQYHFHSWWLHRHLANLSTNSFFTDLGCILKAHLTTELDRLTVFRQTILSRWSLRVFWSSNLTYIFIHQPGHGSVLYWTEVNTVRNTRQPGFVDRTSVSYIFYNCYCSMPGPSGYKKLNRVLLIECVCWLLMCEPFVVPSLETSSAWFG